VQEVHVKSFNGTGIALHYCTVKELSL